MTRNSIVTPLDPYLNVSCFSSFSLARPQRECKDTTTNQTSKIFRKKNLKKWNFFSPTPYGVLTSLSPLPQCLSSKADANVHLFWNSHNSWPKKHPTTFTGSRRDVRRRRGKPNFVSVIIDLQHLSICISAVEPIEYFSLFSSFFSPITLARYAFSAHFQRYGHFLYPSFKNNTHSLGKSLFLPCFKKEV